MNFQMKLCDATLTNVDGRSVLFSKRTGDFYGLNDSANVMVQELLESDFETAARSLVAMYQVPQEVIRKDLSELVAELEKKRLIETVPVSQGST